MPAKKASTTKKTTKKAAPKKTTTKAAAAAKKTAAVKKSAAAKKTPVKKAAVKKTAARKAAPKARSKAATQAAADSQFRAFSPYEPAKNEEYMSDGQVKHFREILLSWRRDLMEEVDRTVNHLQDEVNNFPDPLDRAVQEEEFGIELKTRDRERRLIKKINQTLERIDQDDYGFCDTCGVEIGIRRLEARPTAAQCVDCKSLEELKERQLRG